MSKLYLEDFHVGMQVVMGPRPISAEEIVTFARRYDPQPFHLDDEAGKATPFGGLVASGWHTVSICMRMMVDGFIGNSASMGSPGLDELRWVKPVRPGDIVTLTMTVREVTPSKSKPDRGVIRSEYELRNQRGELVMTMRGMGMYGRRPAAA